MMQRGILGGFIAATQSVPYVPNEIQLRDFNAKLDRETVFKMSNWNKSLCENSSDDGVQAVNFAISKTCNRSEHNTPTWNIHKHIWTSPDRRLTIRWITS